MGALLDFLVDHLPQFRRARLASLYSDFRQQQYSNPDGYAANIAAWETALSFAAESQAIPGTTNSLSISAGHELLETLESKEWGNPSALGTVFTEAVSTGHFVPKAVFLRSRSGLTESSNASISLRLVSWAMKQLGVSSWMADTLPEGQFVISGNLKASEHAQNQCVAANIVSTANEKMLPLLSQSRSRVDRIWPMSEFKAEASKLLKLQDTISDDDLHILLTYLSRDRRQLAFDDTFVKLGKTATESLEITTEDKNIASLKTLIYDLTFQTHQISSRIEELEQQTRSAIANKNKSAALRYLRSKKVQESLWNQRSDTLFQLEDVLGQIEQASNQVEVMSVLKSSTSVLKGLNAQLGDLDTLQDVLDGINEEMLKTKEISNAIGDTVQAGLVIDDGEIDDELALLEAESQRHKVEDEVEQITEKLDHLPALQELPAGEAIHPETKEPQLEST